MVKIDFDIEKLNKSDKKLYEAMTESEKQSFEKIWIQIEENKAKLEQRRHASKERAAREKKALAEKERRERNHRLIERGAILESVIEDPLDLSNEEIKQIVHEAMANDRIKAYIVKLKELRNSAPATSA